MNYRSTQFEPYADLKERYAARCAEYHEGAIGADTFRHYARLFGFSPREVEAEVELHKPPARRPWRRMDTL